MEIQGNYILQLLKRQRHENIETIEASPEAEQAWREHVLGLAERTLLVKTNSWYMGANIPGKKREQLNYLGGVNTYEKVCKETRKDWTGFNLSSSQVTAKV